jgi:beta-glucosidase
LAVLTALGAGIEAGLTQAATVPGIVQAESVPAYLNPSLPAPERAQDLLERMTTDEKIGQTCLVDRQFLTRSDSGDPPHHESDIREWYLGGVFSGGSSAPEPNTVEAWADMVDRFQAYALSTRLGIPILYGSDAVHGHSNMKNATLFPHNIGLGAAEDADLVERIARIVAVESAAAGVRWTFAPSVSVARDPRWGRCYESFGETPDRVMPLVAAMVRGLRGVSLAEPTSLLACAKHYVGDGECTWGSGITGGVDQGNTVISEAALRANHLAPFQAAISEGCLSVMAALNRWNGAKLHGHKYLLTDVLKGELAFEGFVVSDWKGIDAVVPGSYGSAITKAFDAGIDMNMVPDRYMQYSQAFRSAVSSQRISMARLDDAVRRILTVKFRLGLFERPFSPRELMAEVRSPAHLQVARQAVRQSIVLLKNQDSLLPLPKTLARIHVAGRHANDIGLQCGGWSISWQGSRGPITAGTTILQAIRATVSTTTQVTYSVTGTGAAGANVGLAVIGEEPYAEFLGDRQNLRPTASDLSAIRTMKSAGIPVVVVLVSGRPLIVNPEIEDWDAFLAAWLPGTEGQGVADVLFGDHFVTAKLPQSWPRANTAIPSHPGDQDYSPLFPLGFGLTMAKPSLTVRRHSTDDLILTWPSGAQNWVLQSAHSLDPVSPWTAVPGTPDLSGDMNVLTVPMGQESAIFYRLAH